jgi:hypothetical protein
MLLTLIFRKLSLIAFSFRSTDNYTFLPEAIIHFPIQNERELYIHDSVYFIYFYNIFQKKTETLNK